MASSPRSLGTLVTLAFATGLFVQAVVGIVAYRGIEELKADAAWVAHTHQVLGGIDATAAAVHAAESSARGFELTGDTEFRDELRSAVIAARDQRDALARLTSDNPRARLGVQRLHELLNERFVLFDRAIRGDFGSVADFVREGRRTTEAIDASLASIRRHEQELLLRRETAQQRSSRLAYAAISGGLGLSVLISGLAIVSVRHNLDQIRQRTHELATAVAQLHAENSERRKVEDQLRAALGEKDVLIKEVHHRVKNNLQIISSLLQMEAEAHDDPGKRAVLVESENRVRSMSMLHEQLYRAGDLAQIDLGGYLGQLVQGLAASYGAARRGIETSVEGESNVFVTLQKAVPCGLIVNELVSNALKHAFVGTGGRVVVRLERTDGRVALEVADDGVGLPSGFDPKAGRSLGLQLVHALARQLSALLVIEGDHGTTAHLAFDVGDN